MVSIFRLAKKKIYRYIYDIESINVLYDYDDVNLEALITPEPMYGYKAIPEESGKLIAKKHEYQLNTPYEVELRNPYATDFQDCYIHFCKTMEYVLLCPGPTNYLDLTSIDDYKIGFPVIRLFRVKAEGHCVQYKDDWWVTNKLTVLNEITKEEIYEHFMNKLDEDERTDTLEHIGIRNEKEFWKDFLKSAIPPYTS